MRAVWLFRSGVTLQHAAARRSLGGLAGVDQVFNRNLTGHGPILRARSSACPQAEPHCPSDFDGSVAPFFHGAATPRRDCDAVVHVSHLAIRPGDPFHLIMLGWRTYVPRQHNFMFEDFHGDLL